MIASNLVELLEGRYRQRRALITAGTVMPGMTCANWTSADAGMAAQVGHSDGLGPGANANPPFSSWNSAHASQGCNDTAPRGGAGRIYCFAIN